MTRRPASAPPSAWQVNNGLMELRTTIARLIETDPTIVEDLRLLLDMIEGETDAMELVDQLAEAAMYTKGLAQLTRDRAAQIVERAARFDKREADVRAMLLAFLQAMGQSSLERPTCTVSVRATPTPVHIDEAQVVNQRYWRTPPKVLDRAAIKKDVLAGQDVGGAVRGNPGFTVAIRP